MRANMSGLVLETVECLIAQGTFVGSRQVLSVLSMLPPNQRRHHAHCGHFCFLLLSLDLGQLLSRGLLLSLLLCLWIQQTSKIYCGRCTLHVIAAAAKVVTFFLLPGSDGLRCVGDDFLRRRRIIFF
jgi:hypothetical protein